MDNSRKHCPPNRRNFQLETEQLSFIRGQAWEQPVPFSAAFPLSCRLSPGPCSHQRLLNWMLALACQRGHLGVVKLLVLTHGADPESYAVRKNEFPVIVRLPLYAAIKSGGSRPGNRPFSRCGAMASPPPVVQAPPWGRGSVTDPPSFHPPSPLSGDFSDGDRLCHMAPCMRRPEWQRLTAMLSYHHGVLSMRAGRSQRSSPSLRTAGLAPRRADSALWTVVVWSTWECPWLSVLSLRERRHCHLLA